MISGQTLRVCPAGKPLHTFPDHALKLAGARERAGARRGHGPRSHAVSLAEIGFAPEMIVSIRSCRIFDSDQARPDMTAYLISLALAGLVVIAVSEGLS
jgi:hypothetical protein